MPQIVLPADELNEFDLPRVCVVTGQTENVQFKPVKFAWYPRWIVVLVLINVIIAAIVAQVLMRRVKGQLPFSEEAYQRWRMGRVYFGLSFVLALALLFGGVFAMDSSGALGGVMMLLAVASPIAAGLAFVRNKGPVVLRIEDGRITLKLPSEQAVLQLQEHLNAGALNPPAVNAVARSA
ncbi:hypothetical protein [Hyalangium versicolor]|uniref:hypothetical protein n=1 Tax=Hyalangium versicolor TaxID=2861190 RepID=UPI001CCE7186|nr:hypothetical protein [Hyalangium versicolor]